MFLATSYFSSYFVKISHSPESSNLPRDSHVFRTGKSPFYWVYGLASWQRWIVCLLICFIALSPQDFSWEEAVTVCFLGAWPLYPVCLRFWLLWFPLTSWHTDLFPVVLWLLPNSMMVSLTSSTVLAAFTKGCVE